MTITGGERIRAAFVEESLDNLDGAESQLLQFAAGELGVETVVVTVFRAVHSIKGSAGSFGFDNLQVLAHQFEDLLDHVREGTTILGPELTDLSLLCLDQLRDQLRGSTPDIGPSASQRDLVASLRRHLRGRAPQKFVENPSQGEGSRRWRIELQPHQDSLVGGIDPLMILDLLSGMGKMSVECSVEKLPDLESLDPEICHLSWVVELSGDISENEVNSNLSLVEENCEYSVTEIPRTVTNSAVESSRACSRRYFDRTIG